MGWISDLIGSNGPIAQKVANIFDYILGDLKGVLMCGFFGWGLWMTIKHSNFTTQVKNDWVSPREYSLMQVSNLKKDAQVDSFYKAAIVSNTVFNQEQLRCAENIRKRDSVIQEKNFIISGYEKTIKSTIKK